MSPSVQVTGNYLPVCVSSLRANINTQGVYKNYETSCWASETNGDLPNNIPGRHTLDAPIKGRSSPTCSVSGPDIRNPGSNGQSEETPT